MGTLDSETGCQLDDTCAPIGVPCPAQCDPGAELICGKGRYAGADLGNYCVEKDAYSDLWDNVVCNAVCPASCTWDTQRACSGGFDPMTGCPMQDFCQDMVDSCY